MVLHAGLLIFNFYSFAPCCVILGLVEVLVCFLLQRFWISLMLCFGSRPLGSQSLPHLPPGRPEGRLGVHPGTQLGPKGQASAGAEVRNWGAGAQHARSCHQSPRRCSEF